MDGGTRGSGVVSIRDRDECDAWDERCRWSCEMCMCLGFTNPVRTRGVWDVCLRLGGVGGVVEVSV